MAKTQTMPWDPAENLETEQDMIAYLNAALEENDHNLIMATLNDIARAQKIAVVKQTAGLDEEILHNALPSSGNLKFATVLKVMDTLGLRLQAAATHRPAS